MPQEHKGAAGAAKMKKTNKQSTAKADSMKQGTVGSALKKSISKGMGKPHRVG